jgi:hypothetical protein
MKAKSKAKAGPQKKVVKKPLAAKKQRGASVGSLAINLHEGSRSEYLAQYVFSSFGTVNKNIEIFQAKRVEKDAIGFDRVTTPHFEPEPSPASPGS